VKCKGSTVSATGSIETCEHY